MGSQTAQADKVFLRKKHAARPEISQVHFKQPLKKYPGITSSCECFHFTVQKGILRQLEESWQDQLWAFLLRLCSLSQTYLSSEEGFMGNEKGESKHSVSKLKESVAVLLLLWFFSGHEHLVCADRTRLFPCICWTPVTTQAITFWLCLCRLVSFFPVIVTKPLAFTISQPSFSTSWGPFAWLQPYSCTKPCPNLMSVFETRLIDAKDLKRLLYVRLCTRPFIWNLKSFILWKAWWKDDDACQLRLPFALYPRGSARTENKLRKRTAERKWKLEREREKEFITVNANEMFPAYNSLSLSALIKEET